METFRSYSQTKTKWNRFFLSIWENKLAHVYQHAKKPPWTEKNNELREKRTFHHKVQVRVITVYPENSISPTLPRVM